MSRDDPYRELRDLEAREADLCREDREFELRRHEPECGFGRVFRADENVEEGTEE